jgi:KUP system potassium uptake protein
MGEATVTAAAESLLLKQVVVNNVYGFLRKNLWESHKALSIPIFFISNTFLNYFQI